MKFIYKTRTKWDEVDPMYYVRSEVYIDYFREASSELMRAVGFSYKKLEEEGLQFPIIQINCNYFKPLRYDEEIEIETWIEKLKSYQIVVCYNVYNAKKELTTSGKITYGVVTKKDEEPHPMPDELKEKLKVWVEKNL